MLRDLNDLRGFDLRATDGEIGRASDFYFDDERWVVRYLVAETGNWLASRKVLISPFSVDMSKPAGRVLELAITRDQVKNSPSFDTDKPVSRQYETDYLDYYGYPVYWDSLGLWGVGSLPDPNMSGVGVATAPSPAWATEDTFSALRRARHENDDPHLRSCAAVTGYHIEARDGRIGHVEGWIVDEDNWAIRYAVVDTSNWWMGHKVLIAPPWIREVSWSESIVSVNMTRNAIQCAPEWDASAPPSREQEIQMYAHYGSTGYW